MALVMGITLPAGVDIIYNKTLRMYDISVLCNIGKNPRFFPRAVKYNLKEITYLFQLAYLWGNLSADTQAEWNYAANVTGQHNYNLFVQDSSKRLKNGIGGLAVPSLYHQYTTGHLKVQSPATGALVTQFNSRRPAFPCSFELCFKTNLTAAGVNPYAELAFVWTRYTQGQNLYPIEEIDLPLVSGWDKRKKYVTQLSGIRGKWELDLILNDVEGDIWFDNIFVQYSGEIKTKDPYCLNVVPSWNTDYLQEGVTFDTVYPTGGAL